ncbi:hypothetical protein [Nocardiopsis sp. CA-288880]|uniref:hypothetical protein n=1 Tax=Nocardiopsis sp. CA-288880 TaxID=3239995 RepID=UPI003D95A4CE
MTRPEPSNRARAVGQAIVATRPPPMRERLPPTTPLNEHAEVSMFEDLVKDGVAVVVNAMATDAWPLARDGVVRLFRRKGEEEQQAVARRLDEDAGLLARSDADTALELRTGLAPHWRVRLRLLLEQNPEIAEELRALEAEIRNATGQAPQTVQNNTARDGGQVFGALHGNVIVHQLPPDPGRPEGRGTEGPLDG